MTYEIAYRGHILPARQTGRRGNSHLTMMDDDADEVAGLSFRWMTQNGLI